jgi:hypothetical protein
MMPGAGPFRQLEALRPALEQGGVALAVSAVPEGLRTVYVQPATVERPSAYTPSSGAALQITPANALFAMTGSGLGLQLMAALEQSNAPLDQILPPGIDLGRDLFGWMDGEYGLAVLPPEGASSSVGGLPLPKIALLVQTSDPGAASAGLQQLALLLMGSGVASGAPRQEQQGGLTVQRLPLFEELELTWGSMGGWMFLTSGSAAPLAGAAASGGLSAAPDYARLARQLPSPNTGVSYLRIDETVRWQASLEGSPLGQLDEDAAWLLTLAERLGSLVMASGLPRGGWLEQVSILQVR